ncbi:ATP-binding protein [Cardiosporidium cionae]|uniref:ATP-binding protein n=1 Tax=Cardiosporidium cionae TaxID=476202 RepID=A0ABQ7JC45_9APIC|nr:ATP-binding protein [Cardiosporidium cionae]|eukprot:KAF8821570.1 ATP-binding protein [Cardiosporidium cionae]
MFQFNRVTVSHKAQNYCKLFASYTLNKRRHSSCDTFINSSLQKYGCRLSYEAARLLFRCKDRPNPALFHSLQDDDGSSHVVANLVSSPRDTSHAKLPPGHFSNVSLILSPQECAKEKNISLVKNITQKETFALQLRKSPTSKNLKFSQKGTASTADKTTVLLKLEDISLNYGDSAVLTDATWDVKRSDRIGLVGSNGSGKTSLLKLITGYISPTKGNLRHFPTQGRSKLEVAFLQQEFSDSFDGQNTIEEVFLDTFKELKATLHRKQILESRLHSLSTNISPTLLFDEKSTASHQLAIGSTPTFHGAISGFVEALPLENKQSQYLGNEVTGLESAPTDLEEYQGMLLELSTLQDRVAHLGGYATNNRIDRVMSMMGFDLETDRNVLLNSLSGGWKMRVSLAKLLLLEPDILLLDEPTNHLDFDSLEWLEQFLTKQLGLPMIVVSHDEEFLSTVCNKFVEIEQSKAVVYNGNYTTYKKLRAERYTQWNRAWEKQEKSIQEAKSFLQQPHGHGNSFLSKSRRLKLFLEELPQSKEFVSSPPPHSSSSSPLIPMTGRKKTFHFTLPSAPVQGRNKRLLVNIEDVSYANLMPESAVNSSLLHLNASTVTASSLKAPVTEFGRKHPFHAGLNASTHIAQDSFNQEYEAMDEDFHFISPDAAYSNTPPHSREITMGVRPFQNSHLIFNKANLQVMEGDKMALIGSNGSGKSTLLRLILGKLHPMAGSIVSRMGETYPLYFEQSGSDFLNPKLTVYQVLYEVLETSSNALSLSEFPLSMIQRHDVAMSTKRHGEHRSIPLDEICRATLAQFQFKGDSVLNKRVSLLSGGEKARLALCRLVATVPHSSSNAARILLLDEPTNHLDASVKFVLQSALQKYQGTFIVASHDRHFISQIANCIVTVSDGKLYKHSHMDYKTFLDKDNNLKQRVGRRCVHGNLEIQHSPTLLQVSSNAINEKQENAHFLRKRLTFGGKGRSGRIKGIKNIKRWN